MPFELLLLQIAQTGLLSRRSFLAASGAAERSEQQRTAAMVRLTLIARTRDGLPLAEGLDADKEHEMYQYKSQAKVRYSEGRSGACKVGGE